MSKIPYWAWSFAAIAIGYVFFTNNDLIRKTIDPVQAPNFQFLGVLMMVAGAIYFLKRKGVF